VAVNLTVRAKIIDIERYRPAAGEAFLVDTNVWWWAAYAFAPELPNEKKPKPYQLSAYPDFLKRAKVAGALLHWSPLTWPELAHHIERTEFEMAKYYGSPDAQNAKTYRHNDANERARVVQTIADSWGEIEALGTPLADVVLSPSSITEAVVLQNEAALDGYDLFLALALKRSNIAGILTDDGDFATVPGIRVFTANRSVLGANKF
jgi:predicted nucleic acid-binding protein